MADLAEELVGERLLLRRWASEHFDGFLDATASSFDELHVWMSWAATPPTPESVRAMIANSRKEFDANEKWSYGLFEIATNECVGSAGLRRGDARDELEIGYWVRSDRTGRGYAREAAAVLTSAAFDAPLDIARVRISMDASNDASARVPRALGFHYVGDMQRGIVTPGQTGRGVLWTVERAQWCNRSAD